MDLAIHSKIALKEFGDRVAPIARKLARKSQLTGDEISDLIQEGNVGIITAAQRAHTLYWPYFYRTIYGNMLHYLRDKRRLIAIPARRQENGDSVNLPYAILECDCIFDLSLGEIRAETEG